jgi:sterol desaturase/sphingolipid hydroxylase (fatty acid hydroxylase superfamily)
MSAFHLWILSFVGAFSFSIATVVICVLLERLRPAIKQPLSAIWLNLLYIIPVSAISLTFNPLVGGLTTSVVNAAGGGLIVLPTSGLWIIFGILVYLLVMDFAEFSFHCAQHKFAFLWTLHSLHHSDEELNASTTYRHFWAEGAIKSVTIYLLVGLLFKADHSIVFWYTLALISNSLFAHMNLRCGFGRWSWLINTPQYHRLHHSSLPQDWNKRFAAMLPIFDVIFGSYVMPKSDEYPPTGLDDGSRAENLLVVMLWPVRNHFREWVAFSSRHRSKVT